VNRNVEIVGVAGNARIFDLRDLDAPVIYLSYLQIPPKWGGLVVRTKEPPEELAKTVGLAVETLGREYPFWTGTIAEVMSQQLAKERVIAMLSEFFALLALLLAGIGLYGLMSYTVTRRTREIGIRVALGAQRITVLWTVLRETLVLALLGIAIGIPSALLATGSSPACSSVSPLAICRRSPVFPCCFSSWRYLRVFYQPGALPA
jgi:ABC-type antimicrobial peptide transport system permease subunit